MGENVTIWFPNPTEMEEEEKDGTKGPAREKGRDCESEEEGEVELPLTRPRGEEPRVGCRRRRAEVREDEGGGEDVVESDDPSTDPESSKS